MNRTRYPFNIGNFVDGISVAEIMDEAKNESLTAEKASHSPLAASPRSRPEDKSLEPESTSLGLGQIRRGDDDDDLLNEELTPPPDSPAPETPAGDTTSHRSTPPKTSVLGTDRDEIVVGSKNGIKKSQNNLSPLLNPSKAEVMDIGDAEAEVEPEAERESEEPVSAPSGLTKRKRSLHNEDANDSSLETPEAAEDTASPQSRLAAARGKIHGLAGVKGVILGYWRDSPPEDPAEKHAVIGFIDVRDRLRTRIQSTTREGLPVSHEYPVPPGPGGSWVTFERITFDDHLVNLDHFQVKEFVKIRTETIRKGETPQDKAALDQAAVKKAIQVVQQNPPPENATVNPAIAYGPNIPEHARASARPEYKKRRTSGLGLMNSPVASSPLRGTGSNPPGVHAGQTASHASPVDNLPGTRPTRILLGYWKQSSEKIVEDKHAVYGILGANDMFRVKLMKETRDGRSLMGNFPTGPGALWIHWDEVEFENHLKTLTRPEIKEYCRIRQRHLDDGEHPSQRVANETKAVYDAQARVAAGAGAPVRREELPPAVMPLLKARESPAINGNGYDDGAYEASSIMAPPPIHPKHPDLRRRGRHALPDLELRAANRPQAADPQERTNNLARREVARLESSQARRDQRDAHRDANGVAQPRESQQQSDFKDNVQRLNKVWEAQEQNRVKAGVEDCKTYSGIKYERKQSGPFQGKLVSGGTIISIDGEDYVEYRVLTKPTFF